MSASWPAALWLVRHGESVANVATDRAYRSGALTIESAERDPDVPLTPRGEVQAAAVGAHLSTLPPGLAPTRVLSSPYLRALRTGTLALDPTDGARLPVTVDERLRDRDPGILDGLTWAGIQARYPEEARARQRLGKFYHRPPGGESWADVVLRLRGVLQTLREDHASERVVVFTHDVVVLLFRYLLEGLDEAAVLDLNRTSRIVNGGVTFYELGPREGLVLRHYNAVIDPSGRATVDGRDVYD